MRIQYASAEAILDRVMAEVFKVEPPITVDAWADQNRIVRTASGMEPWSTDKTPYLREPMRAWTDPAVDRIVLMFGSQIGKTEMLINCLMYDADRQPIDAMVVLSTEGQARKVVQERLIPSVQATKSIGLVGRVRDMTLDRLKFTRSTVHFGWAKSTATLKSVPVGRLILDEIDEYPDDAVSLARERVKAADTVKEINTSTPSVEGEGIHAAYLTGDQRRFWVPCPHCGLFQTLRFRNLTWGVQETDDEGKTTVRSGSACSPDEVEATAHYICARCGDRIFNYHKPQMLKAGVWVPKGQRITTDESGEPAISGEPDFPNARVRSYQLSSLYSPFNNASFGKMARAFAECGFRVTRTFANGWIGEPYSQRGQRIEVKSLRPICRDLDEGGYKRGELPSDQAILAITAGVDVQSDRVIYEIVGWTDGGATCVLLDEGELVCPEGSGLGVLDSIRLRTIDGKPVRFMVIDSGHRAGEVYAYCERYRTCYPIKGTSAKTMAPYRWSSINKMPPGFGGGRSIAGGGLNLLVVDTDHYKGELYGRLKQAIDAASIGQTIGCSFFADVPEDYLLELTAEHRIIDKRGRRIWTMRPGRSANHRMDIRVYSLALMDALTTRTAPPQQRGIRRRR